MAIYSCNLASIGRTTHSPGTAGAHLRYIGREGAQPIVEAHVIPIDPTAARTWMDREEHRARANARLCDKLRVAIPRELDETQRLQLVRDFVQDLTGGRVPWMFAIHQRGEDTNNPHAHIVLRDRDLETGKRVLRLSDSARDRAKAGLEPKAVEWIRARWERCANAALEHAGHAARIDRRSLEAQGIDRAATIHIGPRGEEVERHVQRPTSKKRVNGAGREIDYPAIDQGRTRKDRNAEIIDMNLERAARSPDHETRTWARFEREQIKLDRKLESDLAVLSRRRTMEQRQLRASFRVQATELRQRRDDERHAGHAIHRENLSGCVRALRDRQAQERAALARKQESLWGRFSRVADVTGSTRRRQSEVRRTQIATHKIERSDLARRSRQDWTAFGDALGGKFAPQEDALAEQRREALATMRIMHMRGEAQADAKRQLREQAREAERQQVAASLTGMMQRAPASVPTTGPREEFNRTRETARLTGRHPIEQSRGARRIQGYDR
jgi:hypothetical protein